MASRYSPYTAPSVDSASDYSPEHEPSTTTAPQTTKRRARGSMTAEERRDARAHRNRLAAQCSRDRKKAQFETLTTRVNQLEEENRSLRLGLATSSQPSLSTSVDATLIEENRQLRDRIQQLEMAWQNMTKILGAMSIPVPPTQSSSTSIRPDALTALPLSPAPTTSSPKSEPIFDEPSTLLSESTCELARFANVSVSSPASLIASRSMDDDVETSLQRVAPSARSLVIRLLTDQKQWERPRPQTTTTTTHQPCSTTVSPLLLHPHRGGTVLCC